MAGLGWAGKGKEGIDNQRAKRTELSLSRNGGQQPEENEQGSETRESKKGNER
jgi:hypothetical protein